MTSNLFWGEGYVGRKTFCNCYGFFVHVVRVTSCKKSQPFHPNCQPFLVFVREQTQELLTVAWVSIDQCFQLPSQNLRWLCVFCVSYVCCSCCRELVVNQSCHGCRPLNVCALVVDRCNGAVDCSRNQVLTVAR